MDETTQLFQCEIRECENGYILWMDRSPDRFAVPQKTFVAESVDDLAKLVRKLASKYNEETMGPAFPSLPKEPAL